MSFVLTLLSDPASMELSQVHVDTAAGTLERAGATVGDYDWLDPGNACDLTFAELSPPAADAALRIIFDGQPFDFAAQVLADRSKALLVADMESTIIAQEMLDELADSRGLRGEISAITEQAMRGELDFETALAARVGKLAGLTVETLAEASRRMTLNSGATALVATMKANGAHTALVSGGFSFFSEQVAEICGFDEQRANRLVFDSAGRLTGDVSAPILGRDAKLQTLQALAEGLDLDLRKASAVGDGANDLAMLRAAGLGVAFHAKPLVRAAAQYRLDFADLTGLLYLQGYHRDEFVEPA